MGWSRQRTVGQFGLSHLLRVKPFKRLVEKKWEKWGAFVQMRRKNIII